MPVVQASNMLSNIDWFLVVSSAVALTGLIISFLALRGESRKTRESVKQLRGSLETVRRARRGAVVCDYVDAGTLVTLATQYGVQPQPDEVEESKQTKGGAKAEAGLSGIKGELGVEQSEAMRVLYRLRFDPHILTESVIEAIEAHENLRIDLASIPSVGLRELRSIAARKPSLATVDELWRDLVAQATSEQFAVVGQSNDYLLIDCVWRVEKDPNAEMLQLELAQLGTGPDAIEMPPGASARVVMAGGAAGSTGDAILTAQGRQRFQPGASIRASVFGRAGSYDPQNRMLLISAISVFTRVGKGVAG